MNIGVFLVKGNIINGIAYNENIIGLLHEC